mgnify:CR=1 FL=1
MQLRLLLAAAVVEVVKLLLTISGKTKTNYFYHSTGTTTTTTIRTPSYLLLVVKSQDSLSAILLVMAATFGLVQFWEYLLINNEWIQAWRYAWPLMGGVYFLQGLSAMRKNDGSDGLSGLLPPQIAIASISDQPPFWLVRLQALADLGLLVGGAADAFLPVYVTGPNLFTMARLGPDSAAILGLIQLARFFQQTSDKSNFKITSSSSFSSHNDASFWTGHALLLSQLYILAAGSIDDVSSRFVSGESLLAFLPI